MARWVFRLLAWLAVLLRQRVSRAVSLPPAAPEWASSVAPPARAWAMCRGCATALADRVYRFDDASYCAACHEEVVELTPDSEDE